MRIPCLVIIALLAGCAAKGSKFAEFSRAASTGLALGQAAVVDAEFETQAVLKTEGNPLKRAHLESASRSHQNALDAMASSDKDVAASRKQFWEMKSAKTDSEKAAAADHAANKWIGWRVRQLFWLAVAIWVGVGVAGIVTGVMGMGTLSAFFMRFLPLSNVFAFMRDRILVAQGKSLVVPVVTAVKDAT